MKFEISICGYSTPQGAAALGAALGDVARAAEDAGISALWVMDHLFQIEILGPPEQEMLEGYSVLAFLAAQTSKVRLGTLVAGVTYRHPGILVKQVTALDVLSGGRANFGIGAAWFEREHTGLGVPFPPVSERFERLEEALQIAHQMWSDDNGTFNGAHYRLAETINSPQSLSRPHPPIMVGGGGEKKTLRLVAKYGDACNVFAEGAEMVRHKLDVLRRHCEDVGRNYDDIEKTVGYMKPLPATKGSEADKLVEELAGYAELGVDTVIAAVPKNQLTVIKTLSGAVIPRLEKL